MKFSPLRTFDAPRFPLARLLSRTRVAVWPWLMLALSALAVTAAADPTIGAISADGITPNGATLSATVNPNGVVSGVQFQFGKTTNYGSVTPVTGIGGGTADVPVRTPVQGLQASTTYHFRVVVLAGGNTASGVQGPPPVLGSDQTFVTADLPPPTATTGNATAIAAGGATLNGSINPMGAPTGVRFEYGLTTAYGTTTATQSVGVGTADVPEQAAITGLKASTMYHFRIVALRSAPAGTVSTNTLRAVVNGADQTFTTADPSPVAPSIKLADATNVTATGAMLHVAVTPNGAATTVHFEYGTDATFGTSTAVQTLDAGTAAIPVAIPVTGLKASTTYHFRVVAANSVGTTTGTDQNFTTIAGAAAPPTATTGVATLITNTGAVLNGAINPNGGPTSYRFEYGLSTSYDRSTMPQNAGAGTADVAVHASVAELIPGTTYHFRVVAIGGVGNTTGLATLATAAVNGADQTFTTTGVAPAPPTVTTGVATQLTTTSAVANGVVNPNGTLCSYRVDFGLDATYGFSTATRLLGSGTSDLAVNAALIGLKPATTYHFRVVAIPTGASPAGAPPAPVFGADQTFSTLELPIGVFVSPATLVTTTSATLNGGVYTNGNSTTVHFEYGTDATYGTSTPDQVLAVTGGDGSTATNSVVRVNAPLASLAPHTVYHFRLVAKDANQTRNSADATFRTGNAAPSAVNDSIVLTGSGPVTIPVLSNDTDADGDTLTVTRVTQGGAGAVAINTDGTVTYTPGARFAGRDTFMYRVEDGFGGAANATVTVQSAAYLARGTYNGLITSDTPANENSGYLRVTTTATGAFTGMVYFAGLEYPLKGSFDANGDFKSALGAGANTVSGALGGGATATTTGTMAPALSLHLDATDGAQQVTGNVTVGTTINSSLAAPRSPFGPGNGAPQAGSYTLLLPAVVPQAVSANPVAAPPSPAGTGIALMTVTPSGLITVTARLGDGTVTSASAVLNGDGTFPLYAGLYGAPRGSIFGTVTFRNVDQISDCDGTLRWFKPAQTVLTGVKPSTLPAFSVYPDGFATSTNLIGSIYKAPKKGQRVLDLTDTIGNAVVQFSDAALTAPLRKTVTITAANTVLPAAAEGFTMAIAPTNGYFSGYFGYPGQSNTTTGATSLIRTPYYGVVFQKQNIGGGVYVTGGYSGAVSVAATPVTTNTVAAAGN